MKKTLLILLLSFTTLLAAQIPDVEIYSFEATTSGDTILATTGITADSAGLTYTVVLFLSEDIELDEGDEIFYTYTGVSVENTISNLTYKKILSEDISIIPLYIIAVVTYDFDIIETPISVATFQNLGALAPDADLTNNFSLGAFAFTQQAVDDHNGPAPDTTNNDTTGMTAAEARQLVKVTTFEYSALDGSGLIVNQGGSYHVSLIKNFEIENGLNVNLYDMVVTIYLSADGTLDQYGTPQEDDLLISRDTISLAAKEKMIINSANSVDIHKYFNYEKSNVEAVGTIGYWGASVTDPEYGEEFLSRALVSFQYRLGDTLDQHTLINYGEATFSWDAVGVNKSLTERDVKIQSLATTTIAVNSNYSGNVTIIDVNGAQVWSATIDKGQNTLNVESLQRGLYILKVDTGAGVRTERVLLK